MSSQPSSQFGSLGLWLEKWNQFGPRRTALVWTETGERWTYAELHRRAMRRAAWLRDVHGVGPGDRVAWGLANRPEFFEVLFACARLGAILLPLNWRLAEPEVAWILSDAEPALVLDEQGLGDMSDAAHTDGELPRVPAFAAGDATPLLILYTSGTTGRPKGAVLTHGSLTANSLNTTLACDLRSDDSTITYTPLFHTGAVNVLSLPLFHRGGKVVLMPAFDPGEVLRWTEREQVSIVFGVPTTFEMLRDDPAFAGADLSSIRFALCGGAPCPLQLIGDYGARGVVFRQGYGLTEVGPNCFSLLAEDAERKAGTVGFPVHHCSARVVDADGNDVAPGQVGELWLAGPHVCAGYWRNPEATAAALRGGWWATGDLFTVDEEGYFRVVGRKKQMFISGGENVYPAEVEQAILDFPGVKECAVVGVPDAKWGEVGRAYVAPASVDTDDLREHLERAIARYKIPKTFVTRDALPRNATGKVARHELEVAPAAC
jgi:fatty-acyl-CoA synthase